MTRAPVGRVFAPAFALAFLALPEAASAQWPWMVPPRADTDGAYAISWGDVVTVAQLAQAWAPILWFSDHEPLLGPPPPGGLPSPLPTDPVAVPSSNGVVYYRATVLTPKSGAGLLADLGIETEDAGPEVYYQWGDPVPLPPDCPPSPPPSLPPPPPSPVDPDPDCLVLDELDLIRLQYLFYFERDSGGGGHSHDLEIAELWFSVRPDGGGHRLVLDQVVGYAHGHKGFANKLHPSRGDPPDPFGLPLVLLVERGKHAPAPDRTGDGEFSPGFDVNHMVSDAWGVRDVFGSSWYGGRLYSSWMTLGRRAMYQAVPPSLAGGPLPGNAWSYELRDFRVAATATSSPPSPDLLVYLVHHDYDGRPQNGGKHLFRFFENFGAGARIDLGLGPYVSAMSPPLPYVGGHVVATATAGVTFQGNGAWYGASALYSPSIAGFFNVYGGATWLQCPSCGGGDGFGPEAGFKFRLPIPHPPTPDFFGLRVGLRYPSFTTLASPRLLLEIGLATP